MLASRAHSPRPPESAIPLAGTRRSSLADSSVHEARGADRRPSHTRGRPSRAARWPSSTGRRLSRTSLQAVARRLPGSYGMSQKSVEIVIGRLATDEVLRGQFVRDPKATLRQLRDSGLDLNPGETEALLDMPVAFLRIVAEWVHPRLQKVALSADDRDPWTHDPPGNADSDPWNCGTNP